MPNVTLHGNEGTRTVSLKEQIEKIMTKIEKPKDQPKDQSALHRNAAFAIVRELSPRLKALDATDTDLWHAIKTRFGVESRSDLTPIQWAVVSAELQCARNNKQFLLRLIRPEYKEGKAENYRAYAIDLLTGQNKRIHEAPPTTDLKTLESRAQTFANNNDKMVRMVRQDQGYCRIFVPTETDIPY